MIRPDPHTATPITDPARQRWDQLHRNAVGALTEAASFAPVPGERIDFAEFLAAVLTAVATNLGSVDRLVAGHACSPGTTHLRALARGESELLSPRADELEWLAPHRTTALVVPLNIPGIIEAAYERERYEPTPEQRQLLLQDRAEKLGVSIEDLLRREDGEPIENRWVRVIAESDTFEAQRDAAWQHYDREPAAGETEDELCAAQDRAEREVSARWERRYQRYAAAFAAHATVEARRLGLAVPVTVETMTVPELAHIAAPNPERRDGDAIVCHLWEYARAITPTALLTGDETPNLDPTVEPADAQTWGNCS
ncbi:hypothetical protein F5X71_34430 [Nocardia brasiliensis]|uniref:Uncharacterized protein n=1 Tax=Nocardia brasiliensis TaxID=37326 RepID=A0A6G9Y0J0_NOCBR|nr:hypothetical protein [Nocardia brasiliensis]QIS06725.1 hypothetical protein F5X71_34430 [Nocardia brasiliensis]